MDCVKVCGGSDRRRPLCDVNHEQTDFHNSFVTTPLATWLCNTEVQKLAVKVCVVSMDTSDIKLYIRLLESWGCCRMVISTFFIFKRVFFNICIWIYIFLILVLTYTALLIYYCTKCKIWWIPTLIAYRWISWNELHLCNLFFFWVLCLLNGCWLLYRDVLFVAGST